MSWDHTLSAGQAQFLGAYTRNPAAVYSLSHGWTSSAIRKLEDIADAMLGLKTNNPGRTKTQTIVCLSRRQMARRQKREVCVEHAELFTAAPGIPGTFSPGLPSVTLAATRATEERSRRVRLRRP